MTSKRDVKKEAKKDAKRVKQKVLKAAKEGVTQVVDKRKEPLHLEDKEVTYTPEELQEAFKGRSTCVRLSPVEMVEEARSKGFEVVPAVKPEKRMGRSIRLLTRLEFLIGAYIIIQRYWTFGDRYPTPFNVRSYHYLGKLESINCIDGDETEITLTEVYCLYNMSAIPVEVDLTITDSEIPFSFISPEWKSVASEDKWVKGRACEDVVTLNLSAIENIIVLKDEDIILKNENNFKEFIQAIPPLIVDAGEQDNKERYTFGDKDSDKEYKACPFKNLFKRIMSFFRP